MNEFLLGTKTQPSQRVGTVAGVIGAAWGWLGVLAILIFVVARLTPIVLDSFSYPFRWYHWVVLVANLLFMAHAEGYRGFQKGFSPRVVARCKQLLAQPTLPSVVFAPLYCFGYFGSSRTLKFRLYLLTVLIILAILVIHTLAQPWRGIIDAGVVLGLSWGVISLLAFTWRAVSARSAEAEPSAEQA